MNTECQCCNCLCPGARMPPPHLFQLETDPIDERRASSTRHLTTDASLQCPQRQQHQSRSFQVRRMLRVPSRRPQRLHSISHNSSLSVCGSHRDHRPGGVIIRMDSSGQLYRMPSYSNHNTQQKPGCSSSFDQSMVQLNSSAF